MTGIPALAGVPELAGVPHLGFIVAAYAFTLAVLAATVVAVLLDGAAQQRMLERLSGSANSGTAAGDGR